MIATVIKSGKTCVALWTSTKINKNYLFGENQPTLLHRNPPFFTDFPSSIENYRVESKQKHKKQPLADASASHLSRSVASTKGQKPLVFGEKPNPVGTWYFTSAHNRDTILNINHLTRTQSIASLPCKIVWWIWYDLLPRNHFIIRGFSPWNGERFLFLIPFTTRQQCIIIFHWYDFPVGANKNGTPKALIDAFGVLWWGDMRVVTNYWRRLGNNSR